MLRIHRPRRYHPRHRPMRAVGVARPPISPPLPCVDLRARFAIETGTGTGIEIEIVIEAATSTVTEIGIAIATETAAATGVGTGISA